MKGTYTVHTSLYYDTYVIWTLQHGKTKWKQNSVATNYKRVQDAKHVAGTATNHVSAWAEGYIRCSVLMFTLGLN
jgi:hypothetical protein